MRPNKEIDIGAVDTSCPLVLCDANRIDLPIVYCSEAFENLTGYRSDEILGKNCRFLQSPNGDESKLRLKRRRGGDETLSTLKRRIMAKRETQTTILNYKKDGTPFTNLLTTIPIRWDSEEVRFVVGFQAEIPPTAHANRDVH
jgi:PAS domain S-box-containing protein